MGMKTKERELLDIGAGEAAFLIATVSFKNELTSDAIRKIYKGIILQCMECPIESIVAEQH